VPDGDYARFVARQQPDVERGGVIVDEGGREVGSHGGVHRFTVGQRKGLGIGGTAVPLYVVRIDAETRTVTVGPRHALDRPTLTASGVNWIAIDAPATPVRAAAQIRHRHRPGAGTLRALDEGRAEFCFDQPQPAVTPGQAVVFYEGDTVIGGGWID
jgi:tRNA-specific 2-thiouridylase